MFYDGCSRKVKTKQHQAFCTTFEKRFHKFCTNINNKQYQKISKQNIPHMCLRCQSNTYQTLMCLLQILALKIFVFLVIQTFSQIKIIFKKCNSIETPFNYPDRPVSIDFKYQDINDFSKLSINKNSNLATIHLKTILLSKHFEDLLILLSPLKHSSGIIGIPEYKTNKSSENSLFKSSL